jgi:hypothetical protein
MAVASARRSKDCYHRPGEQREVAITCNTRCRLKCAAVILQFCFPLAREEEVACRAAKTKKKGSHILLMWLLHAPMDVAHGTA